MNNTIQVLESIGKKYLIGAEGYKAINKAIATLKAVESAEDMLPDDAYIEKYTDGSPSAFSIRNHCQPIFAKQILKVEELEAKIKDIENG